MADRNDVINALKHHFGFEQFKGNQEDVILSLLEGNDVFVLMPTGGGKSLCYQLPALMSQGCAIVISPLIALMKNQVDSIRQFEENDNVAHFLNSSLNKSQIDKVKRDVVEGRTKLLYVAPESLTKEEHINFFKTVKISFYAVDEAHCISEWGHDFRPEYRRIRSIINVIGARPVIALTATATPKVQHDIQKNLGMLKAHVYKSSFNRKNLYYEVRPKTRDVGRDIIRMIKNHPGESGIIYCLSRKKVEEISEMLTVNDVKALPYHAGMDPTKRAANQDAFLHEDVDVIVATIAFGMGIDKPDVRYVVHYDIPKSLEGYYQETGRAGRDGGEGRCITFYSHKDLQKLEKLMQTKTPIEQEIGRQLLQETAGYAESSVCRRKILLHYFGEQYEEDNCGACDNCLHPKNRIDASDELCAVIEAVLDTGGCFRAEYIGHYLAGRRTDEIRSYGHDKNESFAALEGAEDKFISAVIRQGIIAGYLQRDIEDYGIVKVTPKGKSFLDKPGKFEVVEDHEFNDSDFEPAPRGGGAADPQLLGILKAERKAVARRLNLPPYIIFQDPALEAMATTYPITETELQTIPGVGVGKTKKFGDNFLNLIRKYVEDNEIERPDDFKVRTLASRSLTKIYLIQGIDRKIPLDELADNKGLDFLELLDELETIVEGGTKINVDYYLDEILDDDMQQEIIEYFRDMEEDDIDAAISEFSEDYTEEEIRLVRIKFIADMGN
ncbi:MAG: DNA helicase RecQ [Prevotella sp.]|nr:DNA helicase RecQ [Bacteroides sp.]MCM1366162.1 DNA helicase RecQ [Prevotella sp.]MCM1436773.1 DNA helicase RecQ [Prevotella sp.]